MAKTAAPRSPEADATSAQPKVQYSRLRKPTDAGANLPPRKPGKAEPSHQHGYAECICCDNIHAAVRVEAGRVVFTCSKCKAVYFFSGGFIAPPVKEALDEKTDFGLMVDLGLVSKDEMDKHYNGETPDVE